MSMKTAIFSVLIFACGSAFAQQSAADTANRAPQQTENAGQGAEAKQSAGKSEKQAEAEARAARRAREEAQSQTGGSQDLFQGDHN